MHYEYIQKEKNMEKLHWKHFIIYNKNKAHKQKTYEQFIVK